MTVAVTARSAGEVTLAVIGDKLLSTTTAKVEAGTAKLPLTVGADWGTGAYVLATLRRPLDVDAKRMPGRAIGVAWFAIDKAAHTLGVAMDLPDRIRPETTLRVPIKLAGLTPGEEARVVVSAVDVGILNLTNYKAPAPEDYYLGQRKLSAEVRDLYGQLIDGMQGTKGQIRVGGDGGGGELQGSPPTQAPLALYSGIVTVGADGTAETSFDIPAFAGTVRVMAVAWSKDKVGHASEDVIVRDPVVVTATLPRFLLTGDKSTIRLDLDNVEGETGNYQVAIAGDGPFTLAETNKTIALDAKKRAGLSLPVEAKGVGAGTVTVNVTGPGDFAAKRQYALEVKPSTQILARRTVKPLEPGQTLTLNGEVFADLIPGTGKLALSVTPSAALDVAGLLQALDRYPLGCTEQVISRALPLLYANELSVNLHLAVDTGLDKRIADAIEIVLARQGPEGAFGLWSAGGDDPWLDAYVTDFLTRARARGFSVPDEAFKLALERLRNYVSTAPDPSTDGGLSLAYALYVLARNGVAPVGDLRYLADAKINDLKTATAKAEVGAALAMLGDRIRAEKVFGVAVASLAKEPKIEIGRTDYGSALRDAAVVVTLAAEGDAAKPILVSATERVDAARNLVQRTSTQEDAWLVLAARALGKQNVSLDVDEGAAGRALLRHLQSGGHRGERRHHHQYRRRAGRHHRDGERSADHAGAGRRAWLHPRAELPHARRRGRRCGSRQAEPALRGGAQGHRRAAAIRSRGADRLFAGGLRDRQSAPRLLGRHRHARLDRESPARRCIPSSATTASPRPSIAPAATLPSSPSPMWCARSRPETTSCRRPRSRTCTVPTASAAPVPAPSACSPPNEPASQIGFSSAGRGWCARRAG